MIAFHPWRALEGDAATAQEELRLYTQQGAKAGKEAMGKHVHMFNMFKTSRQGTGPHLYDGC